MTTKRRAKRCHRASDASGAAGEVKVARTFTGEQLGYQLYQVGAFKSRHVVVKRTVGKCRIVSATSLQMAFSVVVGDLLWLPQSTNRHSRRDDFAGQLGARDVMHQFGVRHPGTNRVDRDPERPKLASRGLGESHQRVLRGGVVGPA